MPIKSLLLFFEVEILFNEFNLILPYLFKKAFSSLFFLFMIICVMVCIHECIHVCMCGVHACVGLWMWKTRNLPG